jgi:hypothetical protein
MARTSRRAALALLAAVLAPACGDTTTPVVTAPTSSPKNESFSSILVPRGVVSHGIVLSSAGTISVTLASAGPPGTVVGLGLGVGGTGAPTPACGLTQSMETAAGPGAAITVAADAGTYCVAVYDLGTLSGPIPFVVRAVY